MLINVMEYLDQSAREYPDKTAFAVDGGDSLTFKQLRDKSRSIAGVLLKDGFYKEPIAVFMEKSPLAVAANFGAVYSGNYYLPIDREMPLHRTEMIFDNVKPRAVICEESTRDFLPESFKDGKNCKVYIYSEITDGDYDENALAKVRENAIDVDPVYIVFTSGSTGVPKGVIATHRNVIDYIEALSELLGADDTTVFGNQAPLYVDACLKELYTTIRCGATAYLIQREAFMFPVALVELLNKHKINTICWVSSALSMVAALGTFKTVIPETLKTVAFAGELFPVKNLNIWREVLPNTRFINLYGPTEATGVCCCYEVEREFTVDEKLPIGKPFRNTEIVIIDGEICVRGSCLSPGYYNDFERTGESFVQNPKVTAYADLLYRTGDLGGYNERGELVFGSRKDHQIKHMGYRIELSEIETAICRDKRVSLACCLYDSEKSKLILYYTGSVATSEAAKRLKEILPRYMLPNRIFALEQMPLTLNGKIDRNALYQKYLGN